MLRHMVEVSVLIAAFKPSYLAEALRSALAQTQTALEVVVVDDSLGGEIKRIVNETSDHRVRYFRNPERLGPAASHSRAIDEATAPILGVLNDDDIWEPTLVERLFAALRAEPDAVLAFGDHWVMLDGRKDEAASDELSRQWKRDALAGGLHRPFQRLALVDKSVPLAVAALFRKAALGSARIPSSVGGTYDYFLSYLLCRDGHGAVYVPERLASWRIHTSNLTSVPSVERAEEGAFVASVIASDRRLAGLRVELRAQQSEAEWAVATRSLRAGSRARSLRAAFSSLRLGKRKAALLIPAAALPRAILTRPCGGGERGRCARQRSGRLRER
jgi:glycosyltransferase involved in cell wall biosynthesis